MKVKRLKVGVIFGSRSVEHEVSIVTAHQVMEAMDKNRYEIIPLYITKDGQWVSGDELLNIENFKDINSLLKSGLEKVYISPDTSVKSLVSVSRGWFRRIFPVEIDVAFPLVHGTYGEDGTLQGLLELANIPYIGSGVLGSALGMDKIAMKAIFKGNGLPVVNHVWFLRNEWETDQEKVIEKIEAGMKYPLFIKPANLGSSIGISKAKDKEGLIQAIEVAKHYDKRLIVEESLEGSIEVNCSVLGYENPIPSVCEQPVSWEEFLNYEEKYLRGGKGKGLKNMERKIPAPISEDNTKKIQDMAIRAFKIIDCRGVARIDFLVHTGKNEIYINEINTIPGSISFYLWEATGIKFSELIDRLVDLALAVHADKNKTIYSYDSKLLMNIRAASKLGVK